MNITMMLSIVSFFYIIILNVIFFSKKNYNNKETKIYSLILISIIVGILLEMSMRIFAPLYNSMPLINDIVSKAFLLYTIFWFTLITLYCFLISFPEKKYLTLRLLLIVVSAIVGIITILVPIEYHFIEGSDYYSYTYGAAVNVLYVYVFILLLLNIFLVILNRKNVIHNKKYYPIIFIITLFIIAAMIQNKYPEILLNIFIQSLATFIMYFTIENPDLNHIKELNIAKEQAEKANRAKTDFLSNMSHEIRTPLNAIVGFSECMVDSNDLKETKEYATDIVDASKQLLEIVNGILDISKIEANKVEIIPKNYNPREIFDGLRKLVLPRIKEKPIEFKMTFSPDLPGILRGDVSKVKQIILNVLTNAAKYTDKGEIVFNVNCINRMDSKTCLMYISVKDTGHGIKKEKLETIFGKFERIDEDKNTTTEGTGLGLAITKSLVELMGGRITVFSKYGEGSTFRIYLEQEIISMEVPETEAAEEEISYKEYPDKKILIVDDSKINLKVAQTLMKPYKTQIELAASGIEAIELVKTNKYDLIFMDIMMPKMNGVETLEKLREKEDFTTPVVALTADAIEGTDEKYLSVGFNSYLSKPIDRKALNKVINKYLGGK